MRHELINKILKYNSQNLKNIDVIHTENILRDIMSKFDLQSLVDSILKDKLYSLELAKLSYTHTLGFDKLIISPYGDNSFQLRFNIWWENTLDEVHYEDIHNHRWDFSTALLHGAYNYENYRKDKNGTFMYHYHYYPTKNGKNALELIGGSKIKIFSSGSLAKGEIMSSSHDILHRVIPVKVNNPTFTLFLTTRPKIKKVSVYREHLEVDSQDDSFVASMNLEEFSEKLYKLTQII